MLTNEDFLKMKNRANTRKDWIYSLSPYRQYAVYKNQVVWYSDFIWPEAYEVYQLAYWFSHKMWTAEDKKKSKKMLWYAIYYAQNNI